MPVRPSPEAHLGARGPGRWLSGRRPGAGEGQQRPGCSAPVDWGQRTRWVLPPTLRPPPAGPGEPGAQGPVLGLWTPRRSGFPTGSVTGPQTTGVSLHGGLSGSTSPHPRGSPGQPGHARPHGQRLLRAMERSRLWSGPSVPPPGRSRWLSRHSGRPCLHAWAGLGWEAQPARGSPASPAAQPSARPGPCPLSEHPEALESRAGLLLWGVGPEATSPPAWARLGLICPEPWNAALILPASPACTHAARPGTQPLPSRSPTARGPRACTRCWSRVHKPRPLGRGQQDERALGTSPAHRAEKL